jgi:hypothetical protein
MSDIQVEPARWQNYVLEHGEGLARFWETHLQTRERNVLFVVGKGFDPRMCLGIEALLKAGGTGKRDVSAISFAEGETSPSVVYLDRVEKNWLQLQTLIDGRGELSERSIKMWSDDRRRVSSRSAANVFGSLEDFRGFDDLVIDVSSMPRNVYLPLIAKVLYLLDESGTDSSQPKPNLHVFVAEDPTLDHRIRDQEVDEAADYIHGFRGGLEMEATAGRPKVWFPLLGEDQRTQLNRIYDLVIPDEICPVLPSPSVNPRRGDDLVLEYRELLFDLLRVEPRNFIYASERNPFEVYRQIRKSVLQYIDALEPLGGCKAVLSAISSKLMSVGALLVAYELKQCNLEIGIAHVESGGYKIDNESDEPDDSQTELFSLWLAGECYEQ